MIKQRNLARVSALALFSAGIAHAQDTTATAATTEDERTLDVVTVTAQQREQDIVDVPLSISAFGAEQIETFDIQGQNQLSYYTPGLIVQEQSTQRTGYVFRGVTTEVVTAFEEPQITIFTDGVDNSRQYGSILEFVDLERVEVIRGPQGTLFGRGAALGAISVVSRRPDLDDFSGSATAEYGNFGYYNFTGVVNIPLQEDRLGLRLAARTKKRDGTVDNRIGPITELNSRDTDFMRGILRYQPTANWTTDFIVQYQNDDPGPTQFKSVVIPAAGGDTSPFTFATQDYEDQNIERETFAFVLDNNWDVSDAINLNALTSYRKVDALEFWDGDGTQFPFIIGRQITKQEQYSQTLRLQWTPDQPFSAYVGGNISYEEIDDQLGLGLNEQFIFGTFPVAPAETFSPAPGVELPVSSLVFSNRLQSTERLGASFYTNVSWDVTDRLTLEGGFRYDWFDLDAAQAATVAGEDGVAPIAFAGGLFGNTNGEFLTTSDSDALFTPRFVALYELTDNINIYGGVSQGARAGTVSLDIDGQGNGTDRVVDPEFVVNYEIGAKARFGGLVADLALYTFEYTDFQTVDLNDLAAGSVNAGEASADGLEFSLNGEVFDGFTIASAYAYHDGGYDFFVNGGEDLSGNRFRLAPKHTFTLGGNYEYALASGYKLRTQATYAFRSQHFFNDDNQPGQEQDDYSIVNGAIGLHAPNDAWFVEAFGNNIFDEEFVIDIGNTGNIFGLPTAIRGEPQFYGVRVGFDF